MLWYTTVKIKFLKNICVSWFSGSDSPKQEVYSYINAASEQKNKNGHFRSYNKKLSEFMYILKLLGSSMYCINIIL